MSPRARLISIDAVDDLAAALKKFGEEAAAALADLDLEVKRGVDWVQHDRKDHWAQEVRLGFDRVAEARANLDRRLIYRVSEERPSALEEKKALDLAKRRLGVAQQKVEAVRHWSYLVQRETNEYVAVIGQLAGWLQNDLPKALAALKRMSMALEAYVGTASTPQSDEQARASAAAHPELSEDLLKLAGAEQTTEDATPEDS